MRNSERGNVFFYIFLAVALFGALSIAISQSGRESGTAVVSEQNRLRAVEIIDFGDTVAKAVGTIRLRGTTLSALRFSDPALSSTDYGAPNAANNINEVFDIEGGGVNYHPANSDGVSTTPGDYKFLTGNAIEGIGTTCAAANCSELIMVLPDLKSGVCAAINILTGIGGSAGTPPVDSQIDLSHPYQGVLAYSQTIGDESGSAALAGQMYACVKNNTDGKNYFYRVLWQQ